MKFFSERHTPSGNIALMSLFAGINAAFALLATLVPLSDLAVLLLLPVGNALVMVLCEKKYLLPYLVASLLVCALVSCYDLRETLFYVYPAILSGGLYGFLVKEKLPLPLVVFASALLSLGFNYLSLPLIQALYGVDMIAFIKGVFGLTSYAYVDDIIPTFFFGYSLAEIALSHFLISLVFEEFKIDYSMPAWFRYASPVISLAFASLALGIGFVYVPLAYLFLAFALYFALFGALVLLKPAKPWLYVLLGGGMLGSIFLFAICYPLMGANRGLLLLSIFLIVVDLISLLQTFFLLKKPAEAIQ